ncbi:kinase-like domain-containing protein [Stachybotrys elegans]|uniref:Autophagy-related protein 1 n=1 Tax=Stachybotrys elegans TaxID=80388 RepID=A0A8K0WKP4_9HYPO|nr:kinase-like domain-containing protein [Stachybotrys elegans]
MATTETIDLSKVVLILGSFTGADGILTFSDNSRYQFQPPNKDADRQWMGCQSEEPKPPLFYLAMGEHMFDPSGWVLGSDPDSDKCDLQIAESNRTGISRRLLKIDVSPGTHSPRIALIPDRKGLYIKDGARTLILSREAVEFSRPVDVELGAVSFRAWPPLRTDSQKRQHRKLARSFSEDVLRAIPKYIPSIRSLPETLTHNTRYGKDGAVYVNESGGLEGRGAHASVMKVTDRVTGKIYGAKEPYYKSSDDHDAARKRLEALRKEYENISKLDHPYIVRAYDLVPAEDVTLPPWMIIEYIPQDLRDVLTDLDEHDKMAVMTYLSSALQHMHEQNMAHRDVKPENALVERQNEQLIVKLADFGTSKRDHAGKMESFTGTKIYMAPELFNQALQYTNKVDLWSLGLIAMQLYTTWDPRKDEQWDPRDFGSWMRGTILPCIARAPSQFRPLLKGLLHQRPEKRWSAGKCLRWLWKLNQVGEDVAGNNVSSPRDNEGTANDKKRPASMDPELNAEGDERQRRSPHPSISTGRARAASPAETHIKDERSLPSTLSPGA